MQKFHSLRQRIRDAQHFAFHLNACDIVIAAAAKLRKNITPKFRPMSVADAAEIPAALSGFIEISGVDQSVLPNHSFIQMDVLGVHMIDHAFQFPNHKDRIHSLPEQMAEV